MSEHFMDLRNLTPNQREFISQVKKLRKIRNETFSNIKALKNGEVGAMKKNGHYEYLGHWDDESFIEKWRNVAMKSFFRFERKVKDERES